MHVIVYCDGYAGRETQRYLEGRAAAAGLDACETVADGKGFAGRERLFELLRDSPPDVVYTDGQGFMLLTATAAGRDRLREARRRGVRFVVEPFAEDAFDLLLHAHETMRKTARVELRERLAREHRRDAAARQPSRAPSAAVGGQPERLLASRGGWWLMKRTGRGPDD